jgi:PAS domain S-box-containing protein
MGVRRVEQGTSRVQILVVEPRAAGGRIRAALERLGDDARIEVAHDPEHGLARGRTARADLVVVDGAFGADCAQLIEALRSEGPPVVVVGDDPSAEAALEWFRRGAADCVARSEQIAETLPVVALEQIRRWRAFIERGAAQQRIRDLEHQHENIVQNMNSAVLVVDTEGCVITSNPPAVRILGREQEALRGQRVGDWFLGEAGRGIVAQTLQEGARFRGAESVIARPDGSVVPIGISCAPLYGAGGEMLGAVATFQDLSGIQQLQRQVLQTEKMASIGQLAAGVAHEINNPMGFIHANLFQMSEYLSDLRRVWAEVDTLRKAAVGTGPGPARDAERQLAEVAEEVDAEFVLSDFAKAIRESQEGSERIRHIVQDLRDFSHRDTGERVLADLNQCLDSTASIVWPMMRHLVVLEKEYAQLPAVHCNPMQLKQIFMNLLVNAYQAIEEKLGDSGQTGTIRLRTDTTGNEVLVEVSDTGAGISPDHVDRIFDPFFTTKKVGAGTGLGLSTSYNIVQRHGGTIRVESAPGKGTTFRVLLPVGRVEEDGVD